MCSLYVFQNKAAAVVQMFHAHPDPTLWTKFGCGVLCFVKDFVRRSYYIQLIDIVVWPQFIIYIQQTLSFLHRLGSCYLSRNYTNSLSIAETAPSSTHLLEMWVPFSTIYNVRPYIIIPVFITCIDLHVCVNVCAVTPIHACTCSKG